MQQGFIAQALSRRVPQILGLYVAATWMAIEISEWASGRLGLPDTLPLYIFTAMALMLPTVVMLAWFHGAPGRDTWVRAEKILIPVNVAATVGILVAMVMRAAPTETPEAMAAAQATPALETKEVVDETGATRTFEVAKSGFHHRVYGFFWGSDSDQPWIGYAVAWLLQQDLSREPLLGFSTPYELDVRDDFAAAGFDKAVNEPLAFDLALAREGGARSIVVGDHSMEGEAHRLVARVVDVESGQVLEEVEAQDPSLINAAAQISDRVATLLAGDVRRVGTEIADISLAEAVTANEEALQKAVEGLNAWYFDNDYSAAAARLEAATTLDPGFAIGFDMLHRIYRLSGDLEGASRAVRQALALDYKLDSESRFLLKANQYAIGGEAERAIRVLEVWAEVHPDSFKAHSLLARNYEIVGRLDDARAALERTYELNPLAKEVFPRLANLELMRDQPDAAADLLIRYLAEHPDDADARIRLAEAWLQAGNFEEARQQFEEASFVADRDFESSLGIAQSFVREGRFDAARSRIEAAKRISLTAKQQVELTLIEVRLMSMQGRARAALALFEELGPAIQKALPPLQEVIVIGSYRAALRAAIGDVEGALLELDAMQDRLQPPIDGFANMGRVSVYEVVRDSEALRRTLDDLRAFREAYPIPLLDAFITASEARIALWEGRAVEAVAHFETAIAAFRNSIIALDLDLMDYQLVGLGQAERLAGNLERAEEILRTRLERAPALAPARVELAHVLAARGDYRGALDAVERALEQWAKADDGYIEKLQALELKAELDTLIAEASP